MAELIVCEQVQASKLISRFIANSIMNKPDLVLGLATGSSPLRVYDELAKIIKSESIDISKVKGFALDEYVGLPKEHPESYYSVINNNVTIPLGLNPDNVHTPVGEESEAYKAGTKYENEIKLAGGVDIQILGIGTDGHIGFNEPGSSLASRTRIKTLTEQTRIDNARFFDSIGDVPKHCITQGIGTILEAKHLLLLAFGVGKADAVAAAMEGGVTSFCPASALQLHPHVTVFADEAAASKLKNIDYYKYAWKNKPKWQHI